MSAPKKTGKRKQLSDGGQWAAVGAAACCARFRTAAAAQAAGGRLADLRPVTQFLVFHAIRAAEQVTQKLGSKPWITKSRKSRS
jgi:hypothetical protein